MSVKPNHRDTRHISAARALHSRLYITAEGRIFVVSGRPQFEKLSSFLARQDRPPSVIEAPNPAELGLAVCDGELTPDRLHFFRQCLHRWRKEVDAGKLRRRRNSQRARERLEILRLQTRLAAVLEWQQRLSAGHAPSGAPFFLDSAAENTLHEALNGGGIHEPWPPLIAWHARVVLWLGGGPALQRYLHVVVGFFAAYPQLTRGKILQRFQQMLPAWKRRSATESVHDLIQELSLHLRRLPTEVVRQARLSSRPRARTFAEHCDHLHTRCAQLLQKDEQHRGWLVPAAYAALVAADGGKEFLPQHCFQAGAAAENFNRLLQIVAALGAQIGQPGYDRLLGMIDQLSAPPDHHEFRLLRELLGRGNSVTDVLWAHERALTFALVDSHLSIPAARRLSESFATCGWPMDNGHLFRLFTQLESPRDIASVNAWTAWLRSVRPTALTTRLRQLVTAVFWETFIPGLKRHRCSEALVPCLRPLQRGTGGDHLTPLLERIQDYQQLLERGASLPKSLRKLLKYEETRRAEREYLRAMHDSGGVTPSARARLEKLQAHSAADAGVSPQKLRRRAEEAFLRLGLEAQRVVLTRLAEQKCQAHLGHVVRNLRREESTEFAGWIEAMTEAERKRLAAVVSVQGKHGPGYKRFLPENRAWLSAAELHGLQVDDWLRPKPRRELIGGGMMDIFVAADLNDLFLMGKFFQTCLSLGAINEMSVLTNAYDANKQVVFMVTHDQAGRRRIIGRQLIAVSSDFKLIGFHCYLSWKHAEESKRNEGAAAMAIYCARLAAQCGLELADVGTPESLGNHFWYNDGEVPWPAEARSAWAAMRPATAFAAAG